MEGIVIQVPFRNLDRTPRILIPIGKERSRNTAIAVSKGRNNLSILAVLVSAGVGVLDLGCKTPPLSSEHQTDWLVVTREPDQAVAKELMKVVRYSSEQTYIIEGLNVEMDLFAAIAMLNASEVTAVSIKSETKVTPMTFRSIAARFHQSGIIVKEFWVPISWGPGVNDNMARFVPKIIIQQSNPK